MPELPEVEIVRRRLHPVVVGRTVTALVVNDALVSDQSEAELRELVVGRRVAGTGRRGKWLLLELAAPAVVVIVHLRMTGRLLFAPEAEDAGRTPRFVIEFDDGTRLVFFDVRRFGRIWALEPGEAARFLDHRVGIEPLGEEFTVAHLRAQLDGRRAPLKSVILDQRRLAGVGNIYADEALFRARLHPLRPAGSIGPREARRLHEAIVQTLELGISHEGSSVESFVDPAGARGRFQTILNVYRRTGLPCRVCGTPIERVALGGRGTHFCPHCQPRRRRARRTGRAER